MCAVSGDGPLAIAGSVNAMVGTTSNAAVTAERRWTSERSTSTGTRLRRAASISGDRTLRVLGVRDDDADQPPVLWSRTCPDRPLAPPADVP